MSEGPNAAALGPLAAEFLPPILYALELCALAMDDADRQDDARYYREIARRLAEAGGSEN